MATFKHISSKNADYGAAEQYLTFEHDEFTMKPTLDENGRLVPREDYRLATLNCGDEDFAVACMRSNLRYGKNQKREDVKSHHYIISFDPRDGTDNGLTVDKAQSLGEEFCKEHFPGHQAIVCTHPDGHNHSGNIHVHIVIPLSVMFRFIPTISEEWHSIRDAMRFRGIGISVRSVLTKPMMTLEYTMVPLLMSTATIADELAAASLSRGLDADTKRTSIEDVRLRLQDYLLILFSIVIAVTGGMV